MALNILIKMIIKYTKIEAFSYEKQQKYIKYNINLLKVDDEKINFNGN